MVQKEKGLKGSKLQQKTQTLSHEPTTKDKIIKLVQNRRSIKTSDLVRELKISRQTLAAHLKQLVHRGKLLKTGSTRGSFYTIPTQEPQPNLTHCKLIRKLKNLQEDEVFEAVSFRLNLRRQLSKNVYSIAYYAFTEMLNNAIDHSGATTVEIDAKIEVGIFQFSIRDSGIGAFANIKKFFKLTDVWEAAEHLLKGKQTTMAERHSGQGIFFTSRISDRFSLRSSQVELWFDNLKDDVLLNEKPSLKGTEVFFSIKARSKKNLKELFDRYSNEDFEFDRNEVKLGLNKYKQLISRSQARRLLAGLENFDRIVFDFHEVTGIGQAFADEIFRVFAKRFPEKQIQVQNMNQAVQFMYKRTLRAEKTEKESAK